MACPTSSADCRAHGDARPVFTASRSVRRVWSSARRRRIAPASSTVTTTKTVETSASARTAIAHRASAFAFIRFFLSGCVHLNRLLVDLNRNVRRQLEPHLYGIRAGLPIGVRDTALGENAAPRHLLAVAEVDAHAAKRRSFSIALDEDQDRKVQPVGERIDERA